MASNFTLSGSMIPRAVKRSVDQRAEERVSANPATAALTLRGRKHVVRLVNISSSGAMVIFPLVPNIGEKVRLQTLEGGPRPAVVLWVRDGRVGIGFQQVSE